MDLMFLQNVINNIIITNIFVLNLFFFFSKKNNVAFQWNEIKTKRDNYIKRLNGIYDNNLQKEKVERVSGWGEFVDAKTVKVQEQVFQGKNILIATGGRPSIPEIPGNYYFF